MMTPTQKTYTCTVSCRKGFTALLCFGMNFLSGQLSFTSPLNAYLYYKLSSIYFTLAKDLKKKIKLFLLCTLKHFSVTIPDTYQNLLCVINIQGLINDIRSTGRNILTERKYILTAVFLGFFFQLVKHFMQVHLTLNCKKETLKSILFCLKIGNKYVSIPKIYLIHLRHLLFYHESFYIVYHIYSYFKSHKRSIITIRVWLLQQFIDRYQLARSGKSRCKPRFIASSSTQRGVSGVGSTPISWRLKRSGQRALRVKFLFDFLFTKAKRQLLIFFFKEQSLFSQRILSIYVHV